MGLNLSGLRIAQELGLNKDDARAMISRLRQGIVERRPPVVPRGEVECDEVYVKGERGRGSLAKEKPPIFGMSQRGGEVVIRMLANVRQATIGPLIERTIAKGSLVYTDE